MLIILFAALISNNSYAKQEANTENWDVECWATVTYPVVSEPMGNIIYKTKRVFLGYVPRGGAGQAICNSNAQRYINYIIDPDNSGLLYP